MKRLVFTMSGFLFFSFASSLFAASSLPKGPCDQVITHTYYTLCYSPDHRQPLWVAHDLTREVLNGNAQRQDDFRPDPNVKNNPVLASDYRGSGYDRGHMLPAGDMKVSDLAMSETFFMTNISPQHPKLNRGLWAKLESAMRDWVRKYGDAWVVTAPVLKPGLSQISKKVSIPNHYYKIIYIPKNQKVAAFLSSNEDPLSAQYWDHAVRVSEIEKITGLDFLSELPDELEAKVENQVALPEDF